MTESTGYGGRLPRAVTDALGVDHDDIVDLTVTDFADGTGATSGAVRSITVAFADGRRCALVRKSVRRLSGGPHAAAARSPGHWAHVGREALAYRSGLLPTGPQLRAPRIYAQIDDDLYLEDVGRAAPDPARSSDALGSWVAGAAIPSASWLADDQLSQRIAVTDLDWDDTDADPRLADLWADRRVLLDRLRGLPRCLTHGDYHLGNLRADGDGVVALDWATLGVSPVGFDLAHLALSTLDVTLLPLFLERTGRRFGRDAVALGYSVAVALVGASRAHWMLSRGIGLPDGYQDFVLAHRR